MKTQLQNTKVRAAATRIVSMFGLIMMFVAGKAEAQPVRFVPDPALKGTKEITAPVVIHGVVRSAEDNQSIPGVSIYLKTNTAIGTVSDKDGAFEFPRPVSVGEVLLFSSIGFSTFEYEVTAQTTGLIEISMQVSNILIGGEAAVDGVYTERSTRMQRLWSKVKGLF